MEINKLHLLNRIYTYYPKGIEFGSVEYDFAPETELKLKVINQRKSENLESFSKFLDRLRENVNGIVLDESACYDKEFCNYARYDISTCESSFIRFHILLSFLEPFHCLLVTRFSHDDPTGIPIAVDYNEIRNRNDYSEQPKVVVFQQVKLITKEITNSFNSSEIRFSELGDIIPDIETGQKTLGNTTLFDCLFTTYVQLF